MPTDPEALVLTMTEFTVGLSPRSIRHLAATGVLQARKQGKKIWVFDPHDVDEFRRRRNHAC